MRKPLSRKVALVALATPFAATPFAANAADLSILAYKAPPSSSWTGSYFGIYGGASGATGSSFGLGGGLVGGTAGYNWQNGAVVFGIEGDAGWAGVTGTTNCLAAVFTCRASDSWLSSARGRLGWTARPDWLFYATAGGAFGDVREAINSNGSASSDQAGWAAGTGIEWMLAPNWSLNLDFSNSISLWRRMKPATAVFSGDKGQIGSGRSAVV
jgi:outer membrane immunogenic protein